MEPRLPESPLLKSLPTLLTTFSPIFLIAADFDSSEVPAGVAEGPPTVFVRVSFEAVLPAGSVVVAELSPCLASAVEAVAALGETGGKLTVEVLDCDCEEDQEGAASLAIDFKSGNISIKSSTVDSNLGACGHDVKPPCFFDAWDEEAP